MKRAGFSLLELVIALLISSILAAGLFSTLYQVSQVQTRVTSITSIYTRAAIFLNQMEHDLMGAFIPTQTKIIQQAAQPGTVQTPEAKMEPIKSVFSSVIKEGQLELLSFISSSPLAVYSKAKNAKPKPCAVRVVYRMIPDTHHKKSFILMRQEGAALQLEKYAPDAKGSLRAYQMLDGIAQMNVVYYIPDPKQEGDKKTVQYKKLTKLGGDRSQSGQEKDEPITIATLPHFMEVTLSLWDSNYEKQTSFTMTIPIVAHGDLAQPSSAKKTEPVSEPAQEKPAQDNPASGLSSAPAPAPEKEKSIVGKMDFLPEKLRKGITIKEGGSIINGVAA